jgi:methionyl-tRNA formyltransferase
MQKSRHFPLKIALLIGNSCPSGSVKKLLSCLSKQKVKIAQVYAYDAKTLWQARTCAAIELLPYYLKGSQKNIARRLQEKYAKAYAVWLQQFQAQQFDLGVSFFGCWLPPSLFNSPRLGFVNFHPGKLPDLPGFEPETLAILKQWPCLCGTLHVVAERFDEGPILAYTPEVVIQRHELPQKLLKRVTFAACAYLPHFLWQVAESGLAPLPIHFHYETLPDCRAFTKIFLDQDDNAAILRKNRAFNRQKINRVLTIEQEGVTARVVDAAIVPYWQAWLYFGRRARFAKVGEKVGAYQKFRGQSAWFCYRGRQGFIALRVLPIISNAADKAKMVVVS